MNYTIGHNKSTMILNYSKKSFIFLRTQLRVTPLRVPLKRDLKKVCSIKINKNNLKKVREEGGVVCIQVFRPSPTGILPIEVLNICIMYIYMYVYIIYV